MKEIPLSPGSGWMGNRGRHSFKTNFRGLKKHQNWPILQERIIQSFWTLNNIKGHRAIRGAGDVIEQVEKSFL